MANMEEYWKKHLTPEALNVCFFKGTERPGSGKYNKFYDIGTYVCVACQNPLYNSATKYDSGSGWPSFYDALPNSVKKEMDPTGRIEILCAKCGSHLGHIFDDGPNPTGKRYCMNSVALQFTNEAIFAMGCFWCSEAAFKHVPGVLSVKSGYAGGTIPNPTYENHEGYREAVKVLYDPTVISYEKLLDIFWQNIDPNDTGGQYHDRGHSYTTAIYYVDEKQKKLAEDTQKKGNALILPATNFYDAEEYHQNYKEKNPEHYQRYVCNRRYCS